jgi:glycerol kinase
MSDSGGATLAIDQGTSGTKAIVLSPNGRELASATSPIPVEYGPAGQVEVRPSAVWNSVLQAGREAVSRSGTTITSVGLANQGETVLVWDPRSGEPLSPALVWQDRRAHSVCERLAGSADWLRELTGLPLNEYFAAPKMAWLREQGYQGGVVTMIDSWLLHRLTGEFVTDAATASRSLLTDLSTGDWATPAWETFGLTDERRPQILDCAADYGVTDAFGGSVSVTAAAVDQQAALFGQGCFDAGSAKCTYGTGAFLLMNAGSTLPQSTHGLVSCIAWTLAGRRTYCLDGQVFTAGSATEWLTTIGVIDQSADLDRVAATVSDRGGLTFIPALAGLAAPWWSSGSRGQLSGLGLDTQRGHIVQAMLEGIAAQVTCLVHAAEQDVGRPLAELKVDGGLTRSRALMQIQADLLQRPIQVFHSPDATALGVGALAQLQPSSTGPRAVDDAPSASYEPRISADEASERMAAFTAELDAMMARPSSDPQGAR